VSTPIDAVHRQAFGEHRLAFERRIAARLPACHVLRLPSANGADLRRNVFDDVIRRRDLDGVDPRGCIAAASTTCGSADVPAPRSAGMYGPSTAAGSPATTDT
jgi:hypothetical protein